MLRTPILAALGLALLLGAPRPGEPAGRPAPKPPNPKAASRAAEPLDLNVLPWPSDDGLLLYFRPGSGERIAKIRCRLAEPAESPWIVADSDLRADLGDLSPGRHRVEVEALDAAGAIVGSYKLSLDPADEDLRFHKKILAETANVWVELGDRAEWKEKTLYFTSLVGDKEVLREIRYSLDSCALDRRFPLSPASCGKCRGGIDSDDKLYENVPKSTAFACVQLVYRDGETTEPRRFYHELPPASSAGIAPEPAASSVPLPVTLATQRSNAGWLLIFKLARPHAVRDIRYRIAPDAEWRSTGPDPEINLLTGERSPKPTLAVDPLRIAPGWLRIDVKLVDWKGVESGPYALGFDPAAEVLREAKKRLGRGNMPWASFSHHNGRALVFFPLSYKDAFREIRYSFDTCKLDQRFPFDPWTDLTQPPKMTEKKGYLDMPPEASSVCVQLVYRDGETTEPQRFEASAKGKS